MNNHQKPYTLIPHTADVKLRVYGTTLPQLFEHAMIGMFDISKPKKLIPLEAAHQSISLTSTKIEYLLVDFLSDCLSLSDVYNEAYDKAEVSLITNTHLMATISGYKIASFESVEIKAVTYHDLDIHQEEHQWVATLVFDI